MFSSMMKAWFEAAQFGADSQSVIAMRLMKIASGGPGATTEAHRMVSEKVTAFAEAQGHMMSALVSVRANRRRLAS